MPGKRSRRKQRQTVLRELGGGGPADVICGVDDFDDVVYNRLDRRTDREQEAE